MLLKQLSWIGNEINQCINFKSISFACKSLLISNPSSQTSPHQLLFPQPALPTHSSSHFILLYPPLSSPKFCSRSNSATSCLESAPNVVTFVLLLSASPRLPYLPVITHLALTLSAFYLNLNRVSSRLQYFRGKQTDRWSNSCILLQKYYPQVTHRGELSKFLEWNPQNTSGWNRDLTLGIPGYFCDIDYQGEGRRITPKDLVCFFAKVVYI